MPSLSPPWNVSCEKPAAPSLRRDEKQILHLCRRIHPRSRDSCVEHAVRRSQQTARQRQRALARVSLRNWQRTGRRRDCGLRRVVKAHLRHERRQRHARHRRRVEREEAQAREIGRHQGARLVGHPERGGSRRRRDRGRGRCDQDGYRRVVHHGLQRSHAQRVAKRLDWSEHFPTACTSAKTVRTR